MTGVATFASPYLAAEEPSQWLRGNHHGHSTRSDGDETPPQLLAAYEGEGYQYLAFSEHDLFLDPADYQAETTMCLLPAVEVTSVHGQSLMHLGPPHPLPARTLQPMDIMRAVHDAGGLFIFDHPNWQPVPEYATNVLLDSMQGLVGMEIYCGVIERLTGEARATDRWDRLLSQGLRVWGHGTDDQHIASDRFIAWNCVQWPPHEAVDATGVIEALRHGRFYASTGVSITTVGTTDAEGVCQVVSDGDEIHWIANGGVIIKKTIGGQSSVSVRELQQAELPDGDRYVRAECLGAGARTAWTQPFWLQTP